jgi:glycosyltransferase involved in cell wall biosynthesis
MNNVLYVIQPLIASYRRELLSTLGENYQLAVLSDHANEGTKGFATADAKDFARIDTPILKLFAGRLSYQSNVLSQPYRPGDAVVIFADPRFISFWLLLLLSRLRKIKVFAHGQGNFAYPSASFFRTLMYKAICRLSYRYICYNDFVRAAMLHIGCDPAKLVVANNSILISSPVGPENKDYNANGVLFIGRLRHGCRLEVAVAAVSKLRQQFPDICLHVIGGGEDEYRYRAEFSDLDWVHIHGPLYDDQQISVISRECRIGCYPGDAGLSVVHHFALSLPTVVHSEIRSHMGPEPAYVIDGVNGFVFSRHGDSATALFVALQRAWSLSASELRDIGRHAFGAYENLTNPTLGRRFVRILSEGGFTPTISAKANPQ